MKLKSKLFLASALLTASTLANYDVASAACTAAPNVVCTDTSTGEGDVSAGEGYVNNSFAGDLTLRNQGTIVNAGGALDENGITLGFPTPGNGPNNATINNDAGALIQSIGATSSSNFAVESHIAGNFEVNNSGNIIANQDPTLWNVGVFQQTGGTLTVNNTATGVITGGTGATGTGFRRAAILSADGNDLVSNFGAINGDIHTNAGQDTISIQASGTVTGDITAGTDNDVLNVLGALNGEFNGEAGSDAIIISLDTANLSGANYKINGGDDSSTGDTFVDTVVFNGAGNHTVSNAQYVNIESLDIGDGTNAANITINDAMLFGGNINVDNGSSLTACDLTTTTLTVNAGGNFVGCATGTSTKVTGNFVNNGTVSSNPANPVGFNVGGIISNNAGSTLNIIINSDDANSSGTTGVASGVTAGGNIDLNGNIVVGNLAGANANNFTAGESYTVINTTGGALTNSGATVDVSGIVLPTNVTWATPEFTSNSLILSLIAAGPGCTGLDHNQEALCRAINNSSAAEAATILAALNSSGNIGALLDTAHPEGYLALAQAIQNANSGFTGTLRERMGELRAMRPFPKRDRNCNVWGRIHGNSGEVEADGEGHHGYEDRSFGLAVGGDCRVNHATVVGASLGYAQGEVEHDLNFDGEYDMYQAAVYATYRKPKFHVDGVLSYGMAQNEADRAGASIGGIGGNATADYDSQIFGARVEAGYDLSLKSKRIDIEPWAGLEYQYVTSEAFNETGANALSLRVHGQQTDSLKGRLGVRVARDFFSKSGRTHFIPQVRAHYQYELLEEDNGINYDVLGQNVHANSVEDPRSKLVLGIGGTVYMNENQRQNGIHAVYGHYDYEHGLDEDSKNHKYSAGYKYKF